MENKKLSNLKKIFRHYPEIKLVYFFGSAAKEESGPLSDFDFAFYVDKDDPQRIFNLRLKLIDKISRELNTDKVDIVMLNTTEGSELKYNIIKEGKLIYEKEPYKLLVEPRILNEYFDFRACLLKYNLTKA